ncbi:MAG: ATP-dependent zinc metalloprotease FtsH [Bacteroidales bacterium]|nr:ATP-dependent zinc metalloprotease FtsH [Candidatus Physcocola equi]
MPRFNFYWIYGAILITLIVLIATDSTPLEKEIGWNEVAHLVREGDVEEIKVVTNKKEANIKIKQDRVAKVFGADSMKYKAFPFMTVKIPSADKFNDELKEWEAEAFANAMGKQAVETNTGIANDSLAAAQNVPAKVNKPSQTEKPESIKVRYEEDKDYFKDFLWGFGPIILLIFLWIFMMRRMGGGGGGGGIFSVGKSQAKMFDKNTSKVTFKDVAGLSEAKEEVTEIVEFLKNPARYTELGAKIPKGALLVGPPGTGKTLLAKAVAGEAGVPFFSMAGSDFVEMFVGVGASRVRDLFKKAKEKAPCIVFIDEIDAVGRARGRNINTGGNDERENTLNQLLTEMDGFGSNSGVIVLAATNRVEILDKALLRAGRFDRQISVDLPDVHDRIEIFQVHLKPLKLDDDADIDFLARQTPGFSGADIANVCNEAALIAARHDRKAVTKQDFLDAVDRIIGGLEKKNKITTKEEKRSISVHEAGHATISWMLRYANPLVKVTIVPRGKALGAAWYLPEERQLTTTEQMLDELCSLLGGRAAEEFVFGKVSTGAINDLERSFKMAYSMVAYYGFSEKLRNISYYDSTGAYEYGFNKPYSNETAKLIDDEVKRIIDEQYNRALTILRENKEGHEKLANILFEKEVLFAENLEEIFGKRPWQSRADILVSEKEENAKKEKEREELTSDKVEEKEDTNDDLSEKED